MLRGRIPLEWLHAADACGRKGLHVALALWWLAGEQGYDTVLLTREVLNRFGVTPRAASCVLRKMQEHGLCTIARGGGPNLEVQLMRR